MKKLIQLVFLMACPLLVNAQLTGDGTFSSPWSGTLSGDATWSGNVYINGDIIVDNEKLTINPGSKIILVSGSADFIINGTGQVVADGTIDNMIWFTSDDNDNGIFGETGERWGHVYIDANSSASTSLFDYCIIEYGDVTSTGTPIGGGIYSRSGNLALTNCIIRNNRAYRGGGLFLYYLSKLISLNNNVIENNQSTENGGGIYIAGGIKNLQNCIIRNNSAVSGGGIYSNVAAHVLQNCLIYSNRASGTGSGIFQSEAGASKIISCTIAGNTTTGNARDFEYLQTQGILPLMINTIIWGTDIGTLDKNYFSIKYCAFQGFSNPGDHTASFSLSSENDDPNGPNFNAIDGSDWLIKYTSPCLNKGINTYGSPNIIPTNDILGNNRLLTADIGVYEYQYSLWKTSASSTDWNIATNWDGGLPSITRDVIIPSGASNYPVSTPGPDFTIGIGKQMILEPGARVTLDDLINNGSLKMNANADGLSSLILNSYTKGAGATEEIQLRITGGYVGDPELNQGKWHYISSPVQNFPIDPTFTTTTYNLAQWVDGIQGAGSIREGWVAYDGYIYYSYPESFSGPTFDHLENGKGYNLWYNNDTTYTISGNLNTDDVPITLDFAGDAYLNGFNLLGNPFTSGLDWDYIVNNTEYPYPDNTSQGIIFTKDDKQYYYIAGVMVPDNGETPSGVIPPMQGFFVKTYSKNNVINLTTDARSHDDIWPRFKGTSEVPLLRLSITDNEISDEAVVRFAEKAETGLDYSYDALKMFMPDNKPALYTLAGNNKFSINGQPFLQPETFIEIPLSVKVLSNGNHIITLKSKQSLEEYDIYLIDKTTGSETDLKKTPSLSFSAPAGLINNRFLIKISNITIGIEDPKTGDDQFNIYNGFGLINIQTLADEWDGKRGSVRIMDISGKTVSDLHNTEFSKTSATQVQAPALNGLYMIEIKSGVKRYVGKIVIR